MAKTQTRNKRPTAPTVVLDTPLSFVVNDLKGKQFDCERVSRAFDKAHNELQRDFFSSAANIYRELHILLNETERQVVELQDEAGEAVPGQATKAVEAQASTAVASD